MRTIHNLSENKSLRKKLRNNATPQEIIMWSRLKGNQLGHKFRRQHGIGKYIVDFYCPEKKLIIELDGSQHIDSGYDKMRSEYLESVGCKIIRFWDSEVNTNIDGVLMKIQSALE
ncbi:MAG: endonuclease domain-containing protein [bacterium]|nr:endonuclease domain-containing protein [bacterium]